MSSKADTKTAAPETAKEPENAAQNAQEEEGDEKPTHQAENIFTRVVNFDRKSVFLDVRENTRGKYLKFTESSPKRRSTILLSTNAVGMMMSVLDDAIKENYSPTTTEITNQWTTVFSKRVQTPSKKIYFDLMQNTYGRSLNVAEVSVAGTRPKSAVIISEHGWLQLKRALEDIVAEYPIFKGRYHAPPQKIDGELVQSRTMQLKSKRFYLDLMENDMGRLVKIAELKKGRRETVVMPMVCYDVFVQLLERWEAGDINAEVEGLDFEDLPESEPEGHKTLTRRSLTLEADDKASNKRFVIDLRENEFGKFMRLTEERQGRTSAIFVPVENFAELREIFTEFENLN